MAGACGPRNRRRATHISQRNPHGHPDRRLQYGLLEEARASAFLSLCGAEGHVLNHTPGPAIWMLPVYRKLDSRPNKVRALESNQVKTPIIPRPQCCLLEMANRTDAVVSKRTPAFPPETYLRLAISRIEIKRGNRITRQLSNFQRLRAPVASQPQRASHNFASSTWC